MAKVTETVTFKVDGLDTIGRLAKEAHEAQNNMVSLHKAYVNYARRLESSAIRHDDMVMRHAAIVKALEEAVRERDEQNASLRKELEQAKRNLEGSEPESMVSALKDTIRGQRKTMATRAMEIDELHASLRKLHAEFTKAKEENVRLSARNSIALKQISKLRSESGPCIEEAEKRIADLEKLLSDALDSEAEANSNVAHLETTLDSVLEEKKAMKEKLDEVCSSNDKLDAERRDLITWIERNVREDLDVDFVRLCSARIQAEAEKIRERIEGLGTRKR